MTVHAVIPVFNRLVLTQSLVHCLHAQQLNEELRIIVVDDGSTDGTAAWLADQPDIMMLKGDGSLWWGGAIDLALRHLSDSASAQDWVLLMNNDTVVASDFIQRLLDAARANEPAAVGSVIRDEAKPDRLLSIGVHINAWRMQTADILTSLDADEATRVMRGPVEVDALSGRGVLFPLAALKAAGGMRPKWLPHYLADYEVSLRVKARGWRLLVAQDAAVFSGEEYGSTRRDRSWREMLLSVRSPFYLPALVAFWWVASNWPQRLTLPLRVFLFVLFPKLRRLAA